MDSQCPTFHPRGLTYHIVVTGFNQDDLFSHCGVQNLLHYSLSGYACTVSANLTCAYRRSSSSGWYCNRDFSCVQALLLANTHPHAKTKCTCLFQTFAYGQTGSGKTYTMEGLISRSIHFLYQAMDDGARCESFSITAFVLVYMTRDLRGCKTKHTGVSCCQSSCVLLDWFSPSLFRSHGVKYKVRISFSEIYNEQVSGMRPMQLYSRILLMHSRSGLRRDACPTQSERLHSPCTPRLKGCNR